MILGWHCFSRLQRVEQRKQQVHQYLLSQLLSVISHHMKVFIKTPTTMAILLIMFLKSKRLRVPLINTI